MTLIEIKGAKLELIIIIGNAFNARKRSSRKKYRFFGDVESLALEFKKTVQTVGQRPLFCTKIHFSPVSPACLAINN